ncbi:hypothetical protein IQ235_03670 [Oscillatoriales cyanobacterium LEGE 11467]|uniref:Serine kinase n=1 Tax=Zarconia navalis LEGE 11467 TaxID=1828826 RepID=A0A928VT49_9CYAN|nr:hypothetical protein [Zarconia navalis]MBE9039889.1 hypothetical protein [Zarconia navalis LEGE 11467]
MYNYTAYGLGIRSDFKLPGLIPGDSTADAAIRRGEVDRTPSQTQTSEDLLLRVNPTEVCYASPNLGAVSVRQGKEIIVDAHPNINERVLGQFIVGLPLPMLLHQRKLLVLHASAVSVGGRAIAFLGQSGQGKSTTAATLHQRNHPLVTDDALVIQLDGTSDAVVFPSYPQLRLWPQLVTSLGETPENLPTVFPDTEKRSRSVDRGFCARSLPLERIYVLNVGDRMSIEPLEPTVAFQAIMGQSYPTTEISKAMGLAEVKFGQCIELIRRVRVCQLTRMRDLSALSELARAIEEDMAQPSL